MKSRINLKMSILKAALEQGIIGDTAENTNLSTCSDSTQPLSGDELSGDLSLPKKIKSTMLNNGYYLVVICLCWLLRNKEECEERFLKIKDLTDLQQRSDIFKCLDDIVQGNAHGKILLARMKGIRPIVVAASVSIIFNRKSNGKIIPHKFSVARYFDNTRLQVEIKEAGEGFRTFYDYDYEILRSLYQSEDGTFDVSNAITSLFTDVVLSCFMDCTPNLHLVTYGSKLTFVDSIDVGELECEDSNGKRKKLKKIYRQLDLSGVEPCARSAAFLLKFHKYFKRLYLNDADQRFYNFLWCMKEYPLYVISDILTFNSDEELNKLREVAKAEAILRQQAKDGGETLGELPDGSSLVKIRDFMAVRCNAFSNSVRDRVRAAAWLFLWINMSFSGNFDSGISKDRIYITKLHRMLPELLSAALVLQKAEISCEDCVEFTGRFIENKLSVIFVDTPYVLTFGSACKTYTIRLPKDFEPKDGKRTVKALKPFGIDKIKELFSLLSTAKGRVLITHSNEHEVNLAAYCRDIDYLFSYNNKANGCNEDGYETVVYSRNIHEEGFVRKEKTNETLKVIFDKRDKRKEDSADLSEELENTCDDPD